MWPSVGRSDTSDHYTMCAQAEKECSGRIGMSPTAPGNRFQDDLFLKTAPTAKTANNAIKAATM